jgi:hypothetical protein
VRAVAVAAPEGAREIGPLPGSVNPRRRVAGSTGRGFRSRACVGPAGGLYGGRR